VTISSVKKHIRGHTGKYLVYLNFIIDVNNGDIYVLDNNTIKIYSKYENFTKYPTWGVW